VSCCLAEVAQMNCLLDHLDLRKTQQHIISHMPNCCKDFSLSLAALHLNSQTFKITIL